MKKIYTAVLTVIFAVAAFTLSLQAQSLQQYDMKITLYDGTQLTYTTTWVNKVEYVEHTGQDYGEVFTETITDGETNIAFDMVFVEGGTFAMGSNESLDDESNPDEEPVHNVTVDDFYIGKFEVTRELWRAVMGSDPSDVKKSPGDNYPAQQMSVYEMEAFCTRLSEITGKKYMLPTEAQWEYAARGGKKSKGYKYAGSNEIGEVAWYTTEEDAGDSFITLSPDSTARPVGQKKPNELGIYDMSGNVCEMCRDWYGTYPSEDQVNPIGPRRNEVETYPNANALGRPEIKRVGRGGSFDFIPSWERVTNRGNSFMGDRWYNQGLRVVMIP